VANQKRKNRKSKKGAGQRWRVCGEVDEEKQAASSTKRLSIRGYLVENCTMLVVVCVFRAILVYPAH